MLKRVEREKKAAEAKDRELALTNEKLISLQEQAARVAVLEGELAPLREKVQTAERSEVLRGLGVDDPSAVLADLAAIYESRTAGMEKRPAFSDYFGAEGDGRALPLVSMLLPSAESGDPAEGGLGAASGALPSPAAPRSPPRAAGAVPSLPRRGPRQTPQQVKDQLARLHSLPTAERRTKQKELAAQFGISFDVPIPKG